MYRYLLNIAYIGTPFRGIQTQLSRRKPYERDELTIQGQIEIGLKLIRPDIIEKTMLSSRTDTGVHALHTTLQFDCARIGKPYCPNFITEKLNKHFQKDKILIRILRTYLVPNTFCCRRNAISRTYLYRMAVVNSDKLHTHPHSSHIPIEEIDRCYFMCSDTFDIEKMREAAKLFLGTHDFRTFMTRETQASNKISRKTMYSLDITDGSSHLYSKYSWPFCATNATSDYKFYDIYFKASGFVYKQVRRTVGTLIAVAQGKVTTRDIKFMLEIPSHRSWNPVIKSVPPQGLYLCQVEYDKKDLDTFKDTLDE